MKYTGPAPDKNGEFSYPWQAIAYYGHQATHAPTEGERDRAARKLRDARMGALLMHAAGALDCQPRDLYVTNAPNGCFWVGPRSRDGNDGLTWAVARPHGSGFELHICSPRAAVVTSWGKLALSPNAVDYDGRSMPEAWAGDAAELGTVDRGVVYF